jgi:hypothetical protein
MSIFCIIFCILFERFACCLVISASLNEEEIIERDDSLWFWNAFECWVANCWIESFFAKSIDDSEKFLKESTDDSATIFDNFDISFSLSFRRKSFDVFFEIFLSSLNETRISSLEDFLFLNDVSDVVNLIDWDVLDVLDVSASSSADDDLNCSKIFLRSSNHSAKSIVSRVTIRIVELNDRLSNAQSDDTEFFSTKNLKNLAMSRNSCLLDWASFAIADKFEFWFTNCNNRWVCLIAKEWTVDDSNEVRVVTRELFTQNSRNQAKKRIKQSRRWMTNWKKKEELKENDELKSSKHRSLHVFDWTRHRTRDDSKQTWLTDLFEQVVIRRSTIDYWWETLDE